MDTMLVRGAFGALRLFSGPAVSSTAGGVRMGCSGGGWWLTGPFTFAFLAFHRGHDWWGGTEVE